MCFSAYTYLNVLSEISGICVQYFAVSRMVLYTIGRHTTCWCSSTKKSMPRQFPTSPEFMSNSDIIPETRKLTWYRFSCSLTPIGGMLSCYITWYMTDCEIWELNSQYFVSYMQIRVCAKHPPKMGCVLCQDGFGWEIRNTGSSALIFRWDLCLGPPYG